MIRVAFDTSSTRGRKTGIGVYTASLLNALNEYCPEIKTIPLDDNANVEQRSDYRILREQRVLPKLAEATRADLLHLTGFASPLRSRVPVVLTVMDLIGMLFAKSFPPAARFYWSRYLPFTLRATRHIITLSESTRRDVVRLLNIAPNRISVIPAGIDARFRPIEDPTAFTLARLRLQLPERYFLFVSTLEPRKGVDTLLRAYEHIADRVPEHLVIVGKRGWYYKTLFAQARAIGLDRVHFVDYVSDQDLPLVYNLASAFVFPSRYEGFGFTPLEAMACGVPVIASNASSLPEVIGGAGLLIPPNDVTGFAHAMSALSANVAGRNDLRALGLERASFFTWQRAARATAACYASLMPPIEPSKP